MGAFVVGAAYPDNKDVDGLQVHWRDVIKVQVVDLARRAKVRQTGIKVVEVVIGPVGIWKAARC